MTVENPTALAGREIRTDLDLLTLKEVFGGLDRLERAWEEAKAAFGARERGYFTPDEDDRVRGLLLSYRTYRQALWEVIDRSWRLWAYNHEVDPLTRLQGFMIGFSAALVLYSSSLKLVTSYEKVPVVRAKLNEPDAKFGLAAGFFDEILDAYTSLYNYWRLSAGYQYWRLQRRRFAGSHLSSREEYRWLAEKITAHRRSARRDFWGTLRRRLRYDRKALWSSVVHPMDVMRYGVQAFIGALFSRVRTTPVYRPSIDEVLLPRIARALEPGDVLLVRPEKKITTALLPGFWSHAALYVGTPSQLEALGVLASPQTARRAEALRQTAAPYGLVIDATSPGVLLRTLEECLDADHLLALRPRVPSEERREALCEAFGHLGKPYDFEFDFSTTHRLVCTDMVYRSYHGRGPIRFCLVKRLGRYTLSCDDIARFLLSDEGGRCFQVAALILQGKDGRARWIPPEKSLDLLRQIQEGSLRPTREL